MSPDAPAKFVLALLAMLAFLIGSALVTLGKSTKSFWFWLKAKRTKSQPETT